MDALDIGDVLELIEVCQDTLDEIWKQDLHKTYPESRMRQLMLTIGNVTLALIKITPNLNIYVSIRC